VRDASRPVKFHCDQLKYRGRGTPLGTCWGRRRPPGGPGPDLR